MRIVWEDGTPGSKCRHDRLAASLMCRRTSCTFWINLEESFQDIAMESSYETK